MRSPTLLEQETERLLPPYQYTAGERNDYDGANPFANAVILHHPSEEQGDLEIPLARQLSIAEEAQTLDQAAQALEDIANQQTDPKIRRSLLRKAKKLRKNGEPNDCDSIWKNLGGGFLLLVTTPLYITGVAIEGTGTMVTASGMAIKGFGTTLKKLHTCTADKLNM